jgi:hypothetical protein
MRKGLALVCVFVAGLASAAPANAGGPSMLVGAAEDSVRQPSVTAAKAQMDLLRLAGLNSIRISSIWVPGAVAPSRIEAGQLEVIDQAARLTGVRVFVQVMHAGSRTTPLSAEDQRDFASYAAAIARSFPSFRDFVIGNEPNLNRFWLPQYGLNGEDVAAVAYETLLAQTYDALKAASSDANVLGGALAPRGSDNPAFSRPTHSPTAFILDMGAAYRASGRTTPIMDQLAMHPYQDHSGLPPSFQHPNTSTIALADYNKLVAILGQAFDGTTQPGSQLPVVYDEFGVESAIPSEKASLYSGTEPATTHAVSEETQAQYYRDALAIAFCQPTVEGFFFFHTVDERPLDRWQSGIFYADETPKTGFEQVKGAVRASRGGVIARCEGLELTPVPTLKVPRIAPRQKTVPAPTLTCDIDCTYRVRLEKLPGRGTVAALYGKALAREAVKVPFKPRRLAPGRYRFTTRVNAPINQGPAGTAESKAFRLG